MPIEDILKVRLEKLERIKKSNIDPYPSKSWRTHSIVAALKNFDQLAEDRKLLVLAGRIMARRKHGGSTFLDLEDGSGMVQIFLKKDIIGEKDYQFFVDNIDIGDFIEVNGTFFKTKQNEPTLQVEKYRILAKSLRPLPEKWHGLQDVEERYRKRYLDMIFNSDVKHKFKVRTRVAQILRNFLDSHEFIEVETPTLQTLAGGANAKPFRTHINTLNLDVYLRIAPELFLKRLLVGGFERVYEFSRNFRNEGMDKYHNPEFSELEFYAAYKDYEWLMTFTEELLEDLTVQLFGSTKIIYAGNEIDFKKPYKRVTFNEILKKYSGLDYDEAEEEDLSRKAEELSITIEKAMTKGNIADEIYKKVALPKIIEPTFVINHPLDISPLSKRLEKDTDHVARFQLLVAGNEIINAFSELNDPIDQKERFEKQLEASKKGSQETHPYDEDFIEALEYGMPPAAGWGLGLDRLVAILTDSHSIREVILFPLMRPKKQD